MVYPVSDELWELIQKDVSKDCLMLFSGSWRYELDIKYIEHQMFEEADLKFHTNTIFVDPNSDIFKYAIRQIKPKTLAIIQSGLFFRYRNIEDIMLDLREFKELIGGGKVLATVPQERIDFNRLKMSLEQMSENIGAILLGNDLVIEL